MQELLVDFITSLDGYGAAEGWPGWWGVEGPEYLAWLGEQPERDYTILMGALLGVERGEHVDRAHLDSPPRGVRSGRDVCRDAVHRQAHEPQRRRPPVGELRIPGRRLSLASQNVHEVHAAHLRGSDGRSFTPIRRAGGGGCVGEGHLVTP